MREQLHRFLKGRVEQCVTDSKEIKKDAQCHKIARKKKLLKNRQAKIVKANATGRFLKNGKIMRDDNCTILYHVHFKYVIKQKNSIYIEEEIEKRQASFYKGTLIEDKEVHQYRKGTPHTILGDSPAGFPKHQGSNNGQLQQGTMDAPIDDQRIPQIPSPHMEIPPQANAFPKGKRSYVNDEDDLRWKQLTYEHVNNEQVENEAFKQKNYGNIRQISIQPIQPLKQIKNEEKQFETNEHKARIAYVYDRLKAVQYAERWWNDYNPVYRKFEVDCTNYVSQCLHAGGAPMWGQPNRSRGWWMSDTNWSYSWSVAHSLRWYLPTSKTSLRAREVEKPEQLLIGDVICYDFQGDGRYDHNTIVTAKDANGMPLVNAHTANSRMRYWSYEDSTAYTPNIRYKFFTIVDDQ